MQGKSINRRKIPKKQQINNDKKNSQKPDYQQITATKKTNFIYIFLLTIITFAVFSPTFKNTYTNWDDGKYVAENPLIKPLDFHTVKEIFASKTLYKRYWMGNYHPLTMLSLNINYALANKNNDGIPSPFGFQLINIILHILNTLLVFFIIKKLLQNLHIAFASALLFAVHTLHVESVSWIAERKDVLYTFFFLLSLYFYCAYATTMKIKNYLIALILFIFSLLSKGQATSLAITILLIDYFYGRKLNDFRLILEKIPFLLLAFIFGIIAIEAQKQGNALQVVNSTPIITRLGVAAYGFTMYILKLFVPIKLSAVYPYPDIIYQTIPAYYWLGYITVALVVFAAYKTYKKDKIIFLGISFFVVNIFLLLQLIPVGSAVYADRYVYIPSIGFFLIFSYLLQKIFKKNNIIFYFALTIYALFLSVLTVNRIGDWRDSRTLWEDVTKKQPKSVVAWNNLGSEYNKISDIYKDNGDLQNFQEYKQKALNCFSKGIERKPDYTSAYYNRGFTKFELAKIKNDTALAISAIKDLNNAIASDVSFLKAYQQRASIYDWLADYDKAIADFDYALQLAPNNIETLVNRGITEGKKGNIPKAIDFFNKAIKINPNSAFAYSNRGFAYSRLSKFDLAMADYNKAIEIDPSGNTFYNRGMIFFNRKEYNKAIRDFNKAIEMHFDSGEVFFYKAFAEKEIGLDDIACKDMQIAAQKNYEHPILNVAYFCE